VNGEEDEDEEDDDDVLAGFSEVAPVALVVAEVVVVVVVFASSWVLSRRQAMLAMSRFPVFFTCPAWRAAMAWIRVPSETDDQPYGVGSRCGV
jgi:hypothetical protein